MKAEKIKVLLHYYTNIEEDYRDTYTSVCHELLNDLVKLGYLNNRELNIKIGHTTLYTPTNKLKVFCKHLCELDEPVQEWVIK